MTPKEREKKLLDKLKKRDKGKKTDPGRWQNSDQKPIATKCERNTGLTKSAKTKHNWHG